MAPAAPLALTRRRIQARWTNALGHLRAQRYVALFDDAAMTFLAATGLADRTPRSGDTSPFLTEMHVAYLAELGAGDEIAITGLHLADDERRARIILVMTRTRDATIAATCELAVLNMDLATRRPLAWSPAQRAIWRDIATAHATLPVPAATGRAIGTPALAPGRGVR